MGLLDDVVCGPYQMLQPPWNEVLDSLQDMVGFSVDRLWPGEGILISALSLCEEAGEVARAVTKRAHGTRGTAEEWTAEVRKEVGQVVGVCMDIARREGFSLADVIVEMMNNLSSMDRNHDPIGGAE